MFRFFIKSILRDTAKGFLFFSLHRFAVLFSIKIVKEIAKDLELYMIKFWINSN